MKIISLVAFLICTLLFSILFVLFGLVGVDNLHQLNLELDRIMKFCVGLSTVLTLLSALILNHFHFNKE